MCHLFQFSISSYRRGAETLSKEPQFLYLTTTGRVTGHPREIEIWFVTWKGKYYLLAEHFQATQWVKNIQQNPRVRVRVAGREFEAEARLLDPERDKQLWEQARQLAREKYDWGEGLPVEIAPGRKGGPDSGHIPPENGKLSA